MKCILEKRERETLVSVEKCLSGSPSCLSLVSYIPTPPSHTQPLSVGCPVPKHSRNISTHATAQEDATFEPFLWSNSWGGALFTSAAPSDPQTEEDRKLTAVCNHLLDGLQDANCSVKFYHVGNRLRFQEVEISGKGRTKKKSLSRRRIEQAVRPEAKTKRVLQWQPNWQRSSMKDSIR